MLIPAPRANGRAVLEVLSEWSGRIAIDDAFVEAVENADHSRNELDTDPWRD